MLLPMERSQWLSVALIAQTVTRRREALVANAKDFSDFWGLPVDLLEEHRVECIWYPFFPVASRGNPADTRGRTT